MIIVCLDQCAISKLARPAAAKDPINQLRETLLNASGRLQLICPVAAETIVETTGIESAERRMAIHQLHGRLAGGRGGRPILAFKSMWKMIKEETLALARSQPPPSPFELFRWRRIDDDNLAAETRRGTLASKQRMIERVQSHPLAAKWQGTTFKKAGKRIALAEEHASHVYRQLKRLALDEEPDPRDQMGYELAIYLRRRNVTKAELEKLVGDVLHHRWESIPVIFTRTQLVAELEVGYRRANSPRNYDVNDELDIPRLAVGLSSADLVVTDGSMAQLCQTIKTQDWSSAKVFAVRDVQRILEYLEEMGKRATADS